MATRTRKRADGPDRKKVAPAPINTFAFSKANYWILLAGLLVIVVGYITLRMGSITLAPLLLVLGYCVIIPIGIVLRPKKKVKTQGQKAVSSR